MLRNKNWYIEKTRIRVAQEIDVPPDDIEMSLIFKCVEHSIRNKIEKDIEEYIICPKNRREIEAVVSETGKIIIDKIFQEEYPFEKFVQTYEKWYIQHCANRILKNQQKKKDCE